MSSDHRRQLVTVLVFIVTVAVNAAANALPINGQLTAEISDRFQVFVIPAGYVFAIWGVIYLLLGAFTVYQALPAQRNDPTLRALGWLPAITGVLNAGWVLLFQYEVFLATVPVMVALLATLIVIHRRLWDRRSDLDRASTWLVRIPFSVYLGWITIATIANIAQTLQSIGFDGAGIQPEVIASLILALGLAIAATFVWRFHDAAYGVVIVWAYAGIVVKEAGAEFVPLVAGTGAVAMTVLVLLSLAGRLPAAQGPLRFGSA